MYEPGIGTEQPRGILISRNLGLHGWSECGDFLPMKAILQIMICDLQAFPTGYLLSPSSRVNGRRQLDSGLGGFTCGLPRMGADTKSFWKI